MLMATSFMDHHDGWLYYMSLSESTQVCAHTYIDFYFLLGSPYLCIEPREMACGAWARHIARYPRWQTNKSGLCIISGRQGEWPAMWSSIIHNWFLPWMNPFTSRGMWTRLRMGDWCVLGMSSVFSSTKCWSSLIDEPLRRWPTITDHSSWSGQ